MMQAGILRVNRADCRLRRTDDLQLLHSSLAKLTAHNSGKWVLGSPEQIRDRKLRGIRAVAAAHGGDDWNAGLPCLQNDLNLAGDRVNGIDNIIIGMEIKQICVFREEKGSVGIDRNGGIDISDPRPGSVYLVLSDGTADCENLAIEIGEAHPVIIDQIQSSDPHAGQSLHDVAAYTADPENSDTAAAENLHTVRSVDQFGS